MGEQKIYAIAYEHFTDKMKRTSEGILQTLYREKSEAEKALKAEMEKYDMSFVCGDYYGEYAGLNSHFWIKHFQLV